MKSWFQHHFNSMHVYCRLCHLIGRRRARSFATWWGGTQIYNLMYSEVPHVS